MDDFLSQFLLIVQGGGVLMIALFALALAIYWLAIDTLSTLPKSRNVSESLLRDVKTGSDVSVFQQEFLLACKSRRTLLKVLVTTAPLLGLLGTVMGMLATFQGLNDGSGNTLDLVAAGISEAMITTETGLIVAIPALFMLMVIGSRIQAIEDALLKIINRGQIE